MNADNEKCMRTRKDGTRFWAPLDSWRFTLEELANGFKLTHRYMNPLEPFDSARAACDQQNWGTYTPLLDEYDILFTYAKVEEPALDPQARSLFNDFKPILSRLPHTCYLLASTKYQSKNSLIVLEKPDDIMMHRLALAWAGDEIKERLESKTKGKGLDNDGVEFIAPREHESWYTSTLDSISDFIYVERSAGKKKK